MSDPYHDQLARLTRALADTAHEDELIAALADGSTEADVRLFTDGNRVKRIEALRPRLEFLADVFTDLDDRVAAYLDGELPPPGDIPAQDATRFLDRVEEDDVTAEQGDHVACLRARLGVETAARRCRVAHRRFQRVLLQSTGRGPTAWIHLNPVRVPARFLTTALLGDGEEPPVEALFFPAGAEIAVVVLEPEGRALIDELATLGPSPLDRWLPDRHRDRERILGLCDDLAALGLLAFGPPDPDNVP